MRRKKSGRLQLPKDESGAANTLYPTRFKKGHSGNPSGRPKGAKGAASLARTELQRKILVQQNGTKRKGQMTVEQVAYRTLAEKAIAGDLKAFAFLLTTAKSLSPSDPGSSEVAISTEQDLAIIQDYFARMRAQPERKQ